MTNNTSWLPSQGDYKESFARDAQAISAAIKDRAFAPHCDAQILHRPGICWACDGYPDWQQAREVWGINFTGEDDAQKLPCPAETQRPLETINRWSGNIAETVEQADARLEEWRTQLKKTGKRRWRRGQR